MYWPFTYEAKLTMMKETANYTRKYMATKDKSKRGTLYVWGKPDAPTQVD